MSQPGKGFAPMTLIGEGAVFQAADYSDNIRSGTTVIDGFTCIQPNAFASIRLQTEIGVSRMTVFVANNLLGTGAASAPPLSGLTVWVDGVAQTFEPTAPGMAGFIFHVDARASHLVEIVAPYAQYNPLVVGQVLGGYPYFIQVYGGGFTVLPNPSVTHRRVVYGNSITRGALANPESQLGWFPLLRQSYVGRMAAEAWGGRALWDDSGNPGGYGYPSFSALAGALAQLQFDATDRTLIISIGVNDWSPGFNHWSAADFGTGMGTLIGDYHSVDPPARVKVVTLFWTGFEGTANGFGNVPQDYRDAAAAAGAAFPAFVDVIDGKTVSNAADLTGDGLHYNNAGHAFIATNLGPLL